jgi:large subunit ribosomal protein L6
MSRKANKPISIPTGVTVTLDANNVIVVKGPQGELHEPLHRFVKFEVTDAGVVLSVAKPEDKTQRSLWGTFGALVANMIKGVTVGYTKQLEVNGVGYLFEVSGQKLTIKAGYSHPVVITIPEAIKIVQAKNVITLTSYNKQLLGQVAANIRSVRPPEPYKGKGIKYSDEVIVRKQGKQAGS